MNRTATKWYRDERSRLGERRADVDRRIAEFHEKLTDAIRERALLDDVDMRLSMHLPETDYEIVEDDVQSTGSKPGPRRLETSA